MSPPLGPPASVPTLTEVVDLGGPPPSVARDPGSADDEAASVGPAVLATERPAEAAPAARPVESGAAVAAAAEDAEEALVARVLDRLQVQVDRMLEVRLREALAPALVRTADALVRDARRELVPALREAVERAVRETRDGPG